MTAAAARQRGSRIERGLHVAAGCLLFLFVPTLPAGAAADVNVSASVFATATESENSETEFLEQQYSFTLNQELTPYLSFNLGYQHFDFRSDPGPGPGDDLERSNREPRVGLLYNRERFTARLTFQDRTAEGTLAGDNFDAQSILAAFSWRPVKGPRFAATFRDESNVADTAVFGRETDSRFLTLETFYDRSWWGVRYSFGRNDLNNRTGGVELLQNRHEIRATASHAFLDDRLDLNFSTSFSRVERRTDVAQGIVLAEPVAALDGLYAVDTSPEIGELVSTPELNDGNGALPAAPGIDIGGANAFRNVGLDLGVKTPVTRLEISVDRLSGPTVQWQVYHSADNLTWQRVGGEAFAFEAVFLRYTIRFPQTVDRYFKAVNVSVNAEPVVRVTEVRALIDVLRANVAETRSESESNLYQANLVANFRPVDGVTGRVNLGYSNDEDVVEGFARREFRTAHAAARLGIEFTPKLVYNLGFRYSDSENRREPVLLRTERIYDAGLRWMPRDEVEVVMSTAQRDELDEGDLIQSSWTTRLLLSLLVLPDLRLVSDANYLRLDDPFSGIDRRGWTWRQGLESRPTPRWTLGAGISGTDLETQQGETVLERTQIDLRTTWTATTYLTLTGTWYHSEEAGRDNLRQSYSLSYSPGPKLSISGVFQEYSTRGEFSTSSDSISATYRFNNHMTAFGNLSRSKTGDAATGAVRVSSTRFGLRVFF